MDIASQASQASPVSPHVVEITDENFVSAVLEESQRRPVVVDFWAAWCAPCRMIGPVLEHLAAEWGGEFLLGKLDVDSNPQAATAFRIQSIPAVKAFKDGQLVDQFVGVIREVAIREFLQGLVPSQADRLAAQGAEAEEDGRFGEAELHYQRALESEPGHLEAALGLGRLAALRGDSEEARRYLEPLRPHPEAERLLAAMEISQWGKSTNGQGALARGERAAAEGRFEEALESLLREVEAGGQRDQARQAMLKLFSVLGDADPLTVEYRRRLARALF